MSSAIRVAATKQPAKSAIIFLHGLGDSGEGWSWFPQLIKQSNIIANSHSIEYVFPNAPKQAVSANGGFVMPSWFDIYDFEDRNAKQDPDGFLKSCNVLKELIKEQIEKNNIEAEKVIIGGFSQGAAVSLATLSLLDFKIGGVIAFSGFCPIPKIIQEKCNKSKINALTPVFQGHGDIDPIVKYEYGKETADFYKSLGFEKLEFHTYPDLPHSASEDELVDLMKLINRILN